MTWEGLAPPYNTIVADPPWQYPEGWPPFGERDRDQSLRSALPYSGLSVGEIAALPVRELATAGCHLYLWTTNRYLRDSFDVLTAWGFRYGQTLVWCKPPRGIGPGGRFTITTEFVLLGSTGPQTMRDRVDSTWWLWNRGSHSTKPAGFYDHVERVSDGPYVELFARQPRLGWDHWGLGYETEGVA